MKAEVGDRLVTEGRDGPRECLIIGLQHTDGSPPYVVRWLTDGHIALVFPGPFTKLVHALRAEPADEMTGDQDRPTAGRPPEVAAGPPRNGAFRGPTPRPGTMADSSVLAGRIRVGTARFGIAWAGPLRAGPLRGSHGVS